MHVVKNDPALMSGLPAVLGQIFVTILSCTVGKLVCLIYALNKLLPAILSDNWKNPCHHSWIEGAGGEISINPQLALTLSLCVYCPLLGF